MICLLGLDRLGFPRCFDFARASSLSLRCLSGYRDCTGGRRGLKDRARGHGRRSGRAALAAKKIHDPHLEPVSWRSEFEVPYCFDVKFRTPRPVGPDRLEEVFEAAPFKRPLRFYRPDGMNRHDGWLARSEERRVGKEGGLRGEPGTSKRRGSIASVRMCAWL